MLKILLFIPDVRDKFRGEQALLLASGLRERGHAARIVTCTSVPGSSDGNGVDLTALNARDLKKLWSWLCELRAFAPDVIHTFEPFGSVLGVLHALAYPRAALLATVQVPGGNLKRHWPTRLHARTAHWLAPTASLAECWRAAGLPAGKLCVVSPGVQTPLGAGRTTQRDSSAPIRIAVLGPFIRRKGIKEAIWALDILTHAEVSVHLHLIGSGPDENRLHDFARALRTAERVSFHPFAEREQVLSEADIAWMPSLKADEPHAALFALAYGKPVVASKVAGPVDVIVDGETGFLVPPDDKPALARQTLRLIEDAGLRERMGASGRAFVSARFSPDRMVDEHLALYEAAAKRR